MPVFSATYTGKGYDQRVTARSAEWERRKATAYDRNHLKMLERRAEHKAQECVMRKAKLASNDARLAKIYKAAFDKLWAQNTTAQAEDQRREREVLRRKRKGLTAKMMAKRFLVDMNEKKCMHEFGAPFQFARSKMPNRKTWGGKASRGRLVDKEEIDEEVAAHTGTPSPSQEDADGQTGMSAWRANVHVLEASYRHGWRIWSACCFAVETHRSG